MQKKAQLRHLRAPLTCCKGVSHDLGRLPWWKLCCVIIRMVLFSGVRHGCGPLPRRPGCPMWAARVGRSSPLQSSRLLGLVGPPGSGVAGRGFTSGRDPLPFVSHGAQRARSLSTVASVSIGVIRTTTAICVKDNQPTAV